MTSNSKPIGVFDSGIGGLAIAQKIRELLPNERLIYLADTHYAPYGEKTETEILQRSIAITDWLVKQQVKMIVIACNTATMLAIKTLRQNYDLPFIGVEPGVKPAAIQTKTGVIGILATPKTLTSPAFHQLAERVAVNTQVEMQPCPKLVRLVESLKLDQPETWQAVEEYVQPLIKKGADTIILGCTHFAHLAPIIQQVAGKNIQIISTETAVANEVKRQLKNKQLLNSHSNSQSMEVEFWSSGDLNSFNKQIQHLWPDQNFIVKSF